MSRLNSMVAGSGSGADWATGAGLADTSSPSTHIHAETHAVRILPETLFMQSLPPESVRLSYASP